MYRNHVQDGGMAAIFEIVDWPKSKGPILVYISNSLKHFNKIREAFVKLRVQMKNHVGIVFMQDLLNLYLCNMKLTINVWNYFTKMIKRYYQDYQLFIDKTKDNRKYVSIVTW